MAIIRIYTGSDSKSHFEEIHPRFESRGDRSESAELIPGSGITIRRFEASRSNPGHHAPGRAAVLTLSDAVDIEIGDGTVRRLGPATSSSPRTSLARSRHARGRSGAARVDLRAAPRLIGGQWVRGGRAGGEPGVPARASRDSRAARTERANAGSAGSRAPMISTVSPGRAVAVTHARTEA
jgi:hypothetical protein